MATTRTARATRLGRYRRAIARHATRTPLWQRLMVLLLGVLDLSAADATGPLWLWPLGVAFVLAALTP